MSARAAIVTVLYSSVVVIDTAFPLVADIITIIILGARTTTTFELGSNYAGFPTPYLTATEPRPRVSATVNRDPIHTDYSLLHAYSCLVSQSA